MSHLGHLLRAGDTVMGFDLTRAVLASDDADLKADGLPDVVLVKKIYPRSEGKKRAWKLKKLAVNNAADEGRGKGAVGDAEAEARDYEEFLQEVEQDKTLRAAIDVYKGASSSASRHLCARALVPACVCVRVCVSCMCCMCVCASVSCGLPCALRVPVHALMCSRRCALVRRAMPLTHAVAVWVRCLMLQRRAVAVATPLPLPVLETATLRWARALPLVVPVPVLATRTRTRSWWRRRRTMSTISSHTWSRCGPRLGCR